MAIDGLEGPIPRDSIGVREPRLRSMQLSRLPWPSVQSWWRRASSASPGRSGTPLYERSAGGEVGKEVEEVAGADLFV